MAAHGKYGTFILDDGIDEVSAGHVDGHKERHIFEFEDRHTKECFWMDVNLEKEDKPKVLYGKMDSLSEFSKRRLGR